MTFLNLKKINPYKIGMIMYSLLILFVITMVSCSTIRKQKERYMIRMDANNILNTPNLMN